MVQTMNRLSHLRAVHKKKKKNVVVFKDII